MKGTRLRPVIKVRARRLRSSMTIAERRLWSLVRKEQFQGHKFRRQHPVGPFILDFVCLEEKLVIEVDGGQHADEQDRDNHRTKLLEQRGYRVLRFWNNEVLQNPEGVAETIMQVLTSGFLPPPIPSP